MIKDEILKLKNNDVFKKIYSKWRMRRFRDPTLTLEMIQRASLMEYEEHLKYNTPYTTPTSEPEPNEYYVVVNGKSMLNSTWRKMIETQKIKGVTEPEQRDDDPIRDYLLSLFRDEEPNSPV